MLAAIAAAVVTERATVLHGCKPSCFVFQRPIRTCRSSRQPARIHVCQDLIDHNSLQQLCNELHGASTQRLFLVNIDGYGSPRRPCQPMS